MTVLSANMVKRVASNSNEKSAKQLKTIRKIDKVNKSFVTNFDDPPLSTSQTDHTTDATLEVKLHSNKRDLMLRKNKLLSQSTSGKADRG